eukprot:gene54906-36805_t
METEGEEAQSIFTQFFRMAGCEGKQDFAMATADFPQFLRFVRELGDGT